MKRTVPTTLSCETPVKRSRRHDEENFNFAKAVCTMEKRV